MGIENPRKTRQSVFLEQQTKAGIDKEGILLVCPRSFRLTAGVNMGTAQIGYVAIVVKNFGAKR